MGVPDIAIKITNEEIAEMLQSEVLKREILDGDEAHAAQDKLRKFYKKLERLSKKQEPIGRAQSDMDLSKVPQTAQSNICQEEIVTPNET